MGQDNPEQVCVALDWSVRYKELSSKQPSYSLIFGVVFRVPCSPYGPQPSSAIYAVCGLNPGLCARWASALPAGLRPQPPQL